MTRNIAKQTAYLKAHLLKMCSELMALRILKLDEKRDTVDEVYMSTFFVMHPSRPKKASKLNATMQPNTHPNLIKSRIEKLRFWGIEFGMIWAPTCTQNDTKMTPKSTKITPLGSQGATWGSHGPHQMPQDRF